MIELPQIDRTKSKNWQGVVIHHSATLDGRLNDWEGIRRYHTSWRHLGTIITQEKGEMLLAKGDKDVISPWKDVGYHFGIETDGTELKIKQGRNLGASGAHCVGFNDSHIGVCVVGNFDVEVPSLEKWSLALRFVSVLLEIYNFKKERVIGHRESFTIRGVPVQKSCPGILWNMEKFRTEL